MWWRDIGTTSSGFFGAVRVRAEGFIEAGVAVWAMYNGFSVCVGRSSSNHKQDDYNFLRKPVYCITSHLLPKTTTYIQGWIIVLNNRSKNR